MGDREAWKTYIFHFQTEDKEQRTQHVFFPPIVHPMDCQDETHWRAEMIALVQASQRASKRAT